MKDYQIDCYTIGKLWVSRVSAAVSWGGLVRKCLGCKNNGKINETNKLKPVG